MFFFFLSSRFGVVVAVAVVAVVLSSKNKDIQLKFLY
jgi:hypothetical protein